MMKRSHSFDDADINNISECYDADRELACEFDHANITDPESEGRLEKIQLTNGKKISTNVLDILESNNRMEQMEIENYTLRKRCKRLENIVTQLLESKGKTEQDDYDLDDDVEQRKVCRYESHLHRPYNESYYLKASQSPPYCQSESPHHLKNSPSRDGHSSPPEFHLKSNSSLITTSVSNLGYTDVSFPNVSSRVEKDGGSSESTLRLDNLHGITISHPRHIPQTDRSSPTQLTEEKLKTEKKSVCKISPEEMEQQNEIFRATYYAKQSNRRSSQSSDSFSISSMKFKKYYPSRYTECRSYEKCHVYGARSKSPEVLPTPYYSRYRGYEHMKMNPDQKVPDTKHPPQPIGDPTQRDKSKNICNPLNYRKATQLIYPSQDSKTSISESIRTTPHHSSHIHRKSEIKSFPPVRPLPSILSPDPDFDKYNSDFYTKLPPKLHIVESQNENGVTLTWNATSNCDSSLVKSYQLFARELFGHKVGTMKRIGVVDALPLPMSCNIDKLKYNIKYKFAVCAVDIYGRFGKMSNFTGKFELKPKGPITEEDEKDADLEITV